MVGFVIWIVGLILTIKAALEIGRLYACLLYTSPSPRD